MVRIKMFVVWLTNVKSGGSVLNTLLNSKHQSIKALEISALVRGEDKAKVLKEHGVNAILFRDLDDSEALTKAASEHDSKFSPNQKESHQY
jgi:uroporphyrinogen-III synthase